MSQGSSNPTTNVIQVGGVAVDANTGNASAGTQRVVLASNQPPVAITGTFWQSTQPVSIASMPSTPVTGTFWQTTQPVSMATTPGLTDTQLRAAALPVSIASMPSTPVTGTFWQTTQPVSIASMPSTPVTGTFWQGTQPVSMATTPGLTDTQLRATALPVSIASMPTTAVTGTVELGATSLAALENINVTIPGTVDLGTVSLTALETITVTSATASSFLNKSHGAVTTAAPTYTTGTDNALSLTVNGALRVDNSAVTQPVSMGAPTAAAANSPTSATTTAYASSLVSKASAGTLYSLTGFNSKTTGQFIQVHNTATLAADTAVPVLLFYVPGSSNFSYDLGVYGRYFSTGITVCNSTTGPTKTIGAADCWFDVLYK